MHILPQAFQGHQENQRLGSQKTLFYMNSCQAQVNNNMIILPRQLQPETSGNELQEFNDGGLTNF